jgi:anaerobic sulfite reductase subunit A
MKVQFEELKNTCAYREQLYNLASRMFKEEADQDILEDLKTASIEVDDSELSEHISRLRSFAENLDIDEDTIGELAADYASLFLGIGRHPAHPYESVYLSREKIAMREPWLEVLEIYRQEGLVKTNTVREPEDHLAFELEFMAHICRKMREGVEKEDTAEALRLVDVQLNFLQNHLGAWLPAICDAIVHGSRMLDFYKLIAIFTERFVSLDNQYLRQLKDDFK